MSIQYENNYISIFSWEIMEYIRDNIMENIENIESLQREYKSLLFNYVTL